MSRGNKIVKRIETIEDIGDLLHALKTLSAVTARQFEAYFEVILDAQETISLGLQCLGAGENGIDDFSNISEAITPSAYLVIGPERGFCGRLRGKLADAFVDGLQKTKTMPRVIAIGTTIGRTLMERRIPVASTYQLPSTRDAIEDLLSTCLEDLDARGLLVETSRVVCVYASHEKASGLSILQDTLWPPEPQELKALLEKPWPNRGFPIVLGNRDKVVREAHRQHVHLGLLRAFVSSVIAEHTSRLKTLDATESNIDDKLTELRLAANQERQRSITEELIELQANYGCLRPSADRDQR